METEPGLQRADCAHLPATGFQLNRNLLTGEE